MLLASRRCKAWNHGKIYYTTSQDDTFPKPFDCLVFVLSTSTTERQICHVWSDARHAPAKENR